MPNDDNRTEGVPVKLPNGDVIKIEVSQRSGREDVTFTTFSFDQIALALEDITEAIKGAIEKVKHKKRP